MFGQYALGEFSMGEPDDPRPFIPPVVMCASFAWTAPDATFNWLNCPASVILTVDVCGC